MTTPTRRRTARSGAVGLVLALLATLAAPTIAAAEETPAEITADNAALLHVEGSAATPVTLGLVDVDGDPAPAQDTVIRVGSIEAFPAVADASAALADGGHVKITWHAVTLPDGAAHGASTDAGPQIIVTTEDGAGWLLGSATDAPTTLELPAGTVLPTRWRFTAPGSYTVTATATLRAADDTVMQTSAPTTYTFQVADPALPAPVTTDPPAEVPTPDPSASPTPSESPAPSPTANPAPTSPTPTPSPTVPLPAGQSDNPAPDSRDKRIIGAVHTDAVSAYLDTGKLVLETKADIDVTGDGVIDLGSRLTARELLFHLSDHGKITVPNLPAYSFLGKPGSTIWMAPQTQNHQIIWPGFSTEDPNLSGKVQNNTFQVRLVNTEGPGNAEVYMQDGAQVKRIFSSTTSLPVWSIGVPQHTHMNWAFSKPGTYTFTFEMTGVVDGRAQTASNDYTFVVGDLDAHTRTTTTTLTAETRNVATGESVLLSAAVDPGTATGAVQFRDLSTGALLGHTPVTDGTAPFRADALPPGDHRIVAEYVPTWNDDFVPSTSRPVTITVAGEVEPKPDKDDTTPIPDNEITATQPGIGVLVTTAGKKTTPGGTLAVKLTDPAHAGKWVSVWIPGQSPAWQGWTQADLNGNITAQLPDQIKPGSHRLVIESTAGTLIGWDAFTVTGGSSGGTTPPPPPPVPPAPPAPTPQAPGQTCTPGITLETGHIDAFYVSAANGKAVLQLMEDVTGHHVIREAETVLLKVKESAHRGNIPAGTPGTPSGYVLPLTQDPGLIWPGWDTNRTASSGYTDVSINVTGVNGPGRVHLSSQGSFGGVTSLLQSGGYTFPGTIREATPAHTHAQWVFSEKGIYKLTVHAVATNPSNGRSLTTAAHTYVFQVGDVPLGDAFCGLRSAGAADAAEVNAAVNQAAADAVAAAQAAAAEEAAQDAATANLTPGTRKNTDSTSSQDDGLLDSLFGEDADPAVVAGLLTGGGLIVLGIIGATIWYVRRLRTTAPATAGSGNET